MRDMLTPHETAVRVKRHLFRVKRILDSGKSLDGKTWAALKARVEQLHGINTTESISGAVSALDDREREREKRPTLSCNSLMAFCNAMGSVMDLREVLSAPAPKKRKKDFRQSDLQRKIGEYVGATTQIETIFKRVEDAQKKGELFK